MYESTIEMVSETATTDPPFSSAKALKRLSLQGIYIAKNSNTLTPSERSPPLSPPPENRHPPSSSSTILTSPPPPPSSPRDTCQTPNEHFLPSIVVSPPMSTTPIVLEPSFLLWRHPRSHFLGSEHLRGRIIPPSEHTWEIRVPQACLCHLAL